MPKITIVNDTQETVRIAVFKKPIITPTLPTIAWKVVCPGPGGQVTVPIPVNYQAFAAYSEPPDDPMGNQYKTRVLAFSENTARFIIQAVTSQDQTCNGADIVRSNVDVILNEVRMENKFSQAVWGHVQSDGDDIYAPQLIWPGGVRMEDIRSTLYLAVVAEFVYKGNRLVDELISLTQTAILDGGIARVSGCKWYGYNIAVNS